MTAMSVFVHPQGICESPHVGAGTRIWAFAHVLPGARIGADCNICDHVFIENDVVVGDRVTIKSGVQLWDGVRLADDVFVGPNVSFTNDPFPRSRQWPDSYAQTVVGAGASIGAGAVILPGRHIGRGAMVGAGSVVTREVPPNAVVAGNPARIISYSDSPTEAVGAPTPAAEPADRTSDDLGVGGARLIPVPVASDMRGSLAALELSDRLPFEPRRFFAVFDVPSVDVRGEHAHRECHQLLICLNGQVSCIVDDGRRHREVELTSAGTALYIPPMVWGTQYRYSQDAVLAVFASHPYDPGDYIREYEEFLELAAGDRAAR